MTTTEYLCTAAALAIGFGVMLNTWLPAAAVMLLGGFVGGLELRD